MRNEDRVTFGITFNEGIVGAIGGKLPRAAAGTYAISEDSEKGLTVGFATTAIIMAVTRPHAVTVAPSVGADHAGVQLEAKF